jgi:hypothetical protein
LAQALIAPFRGERVLQVVCIKQVADTATRVKVAADGRTLDPTAVTWIMNPYDEFALEQALRIREAAGSGEVVAVSLGGAGVQTTLRNALAIGADRAIHLKTDTAQPDSLQSPRRSPRRARLCRRSCGSASRRSTMTRRRSDRWSPRCSICLA